MTVPWCLKPQLLYDRSVVFEVLRSLGSVMYVRRWKRKFHQKLSINFYNTTELKKSLRLLSCLRKSSQVYLPSTKIYKNIGLELSKIMQWQMRSLKVVRLFQSIPSPFRLSCFLLPLHNFEGCSQTAFVSIRVRIRLAPGARACAMVKRSKRHCNVVATSNIVEKNGIVVTDWGTNRFSTTIDPENLSVAFVPSTWILEAM